MTTHVRSSIYNTLEHDQLAKYMYLGITNRQLRFGSNHHSLVFNFLYVCFLLLLLSSSSFVVVVVFYFSRNLVLAHKEIMFAAYKVALVGILTQNPSLVKMRGFRGMRLRGLAGVGKRLAMLEKW